MRNVVRLHDGLRALYPEAIVFGGIGTRQLDTIVGNPALVCDGKPLSIAVSADGLVIWADAPVLSLRFSQLAAIGVDDGALDVAAIVAGRAVRFRIPLAVPAEAAHIADRVFAALAGRSA